MIPDFIRELIPTFNRFGYDITPIAASENIPEDPSERSENEPEKRSTPHSDAGGNDFADHSENVPETKEGEEALPPPGPQRLLYLMRNRNRFHWVAMIFVASLVLKLVVDLFKG